MDTLLSKTPKAHPSEAGNLPDLIDWPKGPFTPAGSQPQKGRHRLQEMDLFTDEALIDLLDSHPRNCLQAWTMGTDPLRREDWQPVDTAGLSGKELFEAARRGRLWFNILRVHLQDQRYRNVADRLFSELATHHRGFEYLSYTVTLLISSPNAMVYYHADAPPSMLWHIRGEKRLWLYPVEEPYLPKDMMEEIFASLRDEEITYSPDYDQASWVSDLGPGDCVWWPHNAPHRVVNADSLNVSLSTRYQTKESERRKLIYNANRFFRLKFGIPARSVEETGLAAFSKCFAYRVFRRAGLDRHPTGYSYVSSYRVDPNAAMGYSPLPSPAKTAFSQ